MTLKDFEAWMAIGQNISDEAKLTEDDTCETVASADPQLTEEKSVGRKRRRCPRNR
jgi:hypothetical protein